MTIQEASRYVTEQLRSIYPEGEAASISNWVMENLSGPDRFSQANSNLSPEKSGQLKAVLQRLLTYEPVQYILNESWFCGLKFYVDKNVLIPRPETEELVEWIISNCRFPIDTLRILDIGSGSGCIPVALKRRIRKAEVWSVDKSVAALEVANRNAASLGAPVNFQHLDFLDRGQWHILPAFDIIVSNPPYVPVKDKGKMQPNVLNYEPAEALFVPDNDPLVFYEAIAGFGKTHLNANGAIYAEMHEDLGNDVRLLFESHGYLVELKKDMQGKERMIKCVSDKIKGM